MKDSKEIKCQVYVRAKHEVWYQAAKSFGGIKAWEKWDNGKTPRYVKEVGFKFRFPVLSIQKEENTSHDFVIFDGSGNSIGKRLDGLRVITFKGETTEGRLIISESIIDETFTQKNSQHKTYVYCYIKENVPFAMFSECVWLSKDHFHDFQGAFRSGSYLKEEEIDLVMAGGILPARF